LYSPRRPPSPSPRCTHPSPCRAPRPPRPPTLCHPLVLRIIVARLVLLVLQLRVASSSERPCLTTRPRPTPTPSPHLEERAARRYTCSLSWASLLCYLASAPPRSRAVMPHARRLGKSRRRAMVMATICGRRQAAWRPGRLGKEKG